MHEVMGNRKIALCRELTKKFEEFIRGTVSEVIEWAKEDEIRGEFCLIIEGQFTRAKSGRAQPGGRISLLKSM